MKSDKLLFELDPDLQMLLAANDTAVGRIEILLIQILRQLKKK